MSRQVLWRVIDGKKCRYCIHLVTGRQCNSSQSPHFQKRVAFDDSCSYFQLSQAQVKCTTLQADFLRYLTDKGSPDAGKVLQNIINGYTEAITAGLPAEDEIEARLGIASAYAQIVINREMKVSGYSVLDSMESKKVTENLQGAADIDKRNSLQHIAEIPYALYGIDDFLDARSAQLSKSDHDAAEQNIRQHLAIFDYLPRTPFPDLLLLLGLLLWAENNHDDAASCFKEVIEVADDTRQAPGALRKTRQDAMTFFNKCSLSARRAAIKGRTFSNKDKIASSGSGCLLIVVAGLIGLILLMKL